MCTYKMIYSDLKQPIQAMQNLFRQLSLKLFNSSINFLNMFGSINSFNDLFLAIHSSYQQLCIFIFKLYSFNFSLFLIFFIFKKRYLDLMKHMQSFTLLFYL